MLTLSNVVKLGNTLGSEALGHVLSMHEISVSKFQHLLKITVLGFPINHHSKK